MPSERYNAGNNVNSNRPLMPTLASTRTAKSPITPRLAASATHQSLTSPASRRSAARSEASGTPRNGARDDATTPVKAFLSSNITPRSSSRKSRIGVESNVSTPTGTPSGTPTISRPTSTVQTTEDTTGATNYGGATPGLFRAPVSKATGIHNGEKTTNSTVAGRPAGAGGHARNRSEAGGIDSGPKFFHVNEANSQRTDLKLDQKKSPTFFFANGERETSPGLRSGPSSPSLSAVGRDNPLNKFFHADGQAESRSTSPRLSSLNCTTSPRSSIVGNPTQNIPSLRPPSPAKENIHLSYRRGASQIIRPNEFRPALPTILPSAQTSTQTTPVAQRTSSRRSSLDTPAKRATNHAKTASLSSIDSGNSSRKSARPSLEPASAPLTPLDTTTTAQPLDRLSLGATSTISDVKSDLSTFSASAAGLISPTKSTFGGGQHNLQQMNELAANARRERKVLDLEISNSSLLAINRSLEREMRKQKAELRRFRRLSRSGRLSLDTLRTSGGLTALEADFGDGLSDLDEDEDEREGGDRDEDGLSSEDASADDDEEPMSPTALAEFDARHRFKDEKRLQLDLSKHRELLIDSQKMNQSLKRCLGWTEELIKEGRKALEYQVRVSDVKLGGRVLAPEHGEMVHEEDGGEDEDTLMGQGGALLGAWKEPDQMGRESLDSGGDRDSGIEMENILQAIELLTPGATGRLTDILGETF